MTEIKPCCDLAVAIETCEEELRLDGYAVIRNGNAIFPIFEAAKRYHAIPDTPASPETSTASDPAVREAWYIKPLKWKRVKGNGWEYCENQTQDRLYQIYKRIHSDETFRLIGHGTHIADYKTERAAINAAEKHYKKVATIFLTRAALKAQLED